MRWLALLILVPAESLAAVCGGLNPVLVANTPLSFGNYDATTNSDTPANATITTTCTVTLGNVLPSFTVTVSTGGSNSFAARQLSFLTQTLNYNLYTASNYNTVWGDGTAGTGTVSYNTGDGLSTKAYTIYGLISKHQYVPTGLYLDAPTVTITY